MIKEYSKIGEYHIANHKKSEDYLLSEDNENMMFLCLADGVSSCENSLQGAKVISNKVKDIVAHIDLFHFDEEVIKKLVIDELQYSLRQISQNENIDFLSLSSTLLFVYYNKRKNKTLVFSLGDSLSLTVFNKEIEIVSYPVQNFQGIYTVTHHNIKEHTHIHIFDGCLQNIYLFSDGAWKEMVEENKIKKSIKDILIRKDYQMLDDYFNHCHNYDDCSYIGGTF